jgi:hypothetical protein
MLARADRRTVIGVAARGCLVPAGALAVHQLRYMLAFGVSAGGVLARQGHSYLHSVVPWIVLALGIALGAFLWSIGRAMGGRRSLSRYAVSFTALWTLCSAGLLSLYILQEILEGLLISGHPAGLVGVFGYGGWWAAPVAVCVGLVLAAFFHGATWVLDEVTRRRANSTADATEAAAVPRPRDFLLPRLQPLALGQSGRGPPA